MDNGAENYRRYVAGEDEGLVALITAYQAPLYRFLVGYVQDEVGS